MKVAAVGIPWYKREDYDRLLSLFSDSERLPTTYDAWLKKAEGLVDQLRRNGQAFRKVYLDLDAFPAWCAARGLNLDAQARIRFANEFVGRKDLNEHE